MPKTGSCGGANGVLWGSSKNPAPILFWAETYLRNMRREWPRSPLAIVFDIDDTVLAGWPQKKIKPVLDLYRMAQRELNYTIFFVTARLDEAGAEESTRKQLHREGFRDFKDLFLMPKTYLDHPNFSMFKFQMRKKISDRGYYIVLNMGDTWHDLMLLPPFQNHPQFAHKCNQLMKHSKSEYLIFQPPDLSWMAIKFPERR
jgi:predicted secreted acid phosphatase